MTPAFYEILSPSESWSAPIPESRLIDYIRDGMIGPDTRLRETSTGREFDLHESPLFAALYQSLAGGRLSQPAVPDLTSPTDVREPPHSSGSSTSNTNKGFDANLGQGNQQAAPIPRGDVPRMRGCPNCKRMVPNLRANCVSCGYTFPQNTIRVAPGSAQPSEDAHLAGQQRQENNERVPSLSHATGSPDARPVNGSRPLDPYAGLSDRDALVLREFAQQREQFVWWSVIGFAFGMSFFSLILAAYAIMRLQSIRQSVAQLGVDPVRWNAFESARFWKVFQPHIRICCGVFVTFVIIAVVLVLLTPTQSVPVYPH